MGVYGKCATCGEDNIGAERRPDGDVFCKNGHKTTRKQLSDDVLLSSNKELTARLTALETEAAALREAVRVLGAEVRDWRSAWEVWNDSNNPRAYIANKESADVDTNPIAAAAVKGGGQ